MKVCTFLGDPFRIYDEVTQRIEEALEEILAAHGEMELYFPGWFGEFPRACAAAALRVKGRHPDRIVTLTLAVSAQWQEEPAACCVFDRIIRIPVLENSPDMGRHRLLQAILRRCDCLISYVYLELRGEEAQILSSVRRRRRLTVLDVTDPDTAAYLKEHIRAAAGRAAGFPGRGPCAAPGGFRRARYLHSVLVQDGVQNPGRPAEAAHRPV